MDRRKTWQPALDPEELARFFVLRANTGDVDGLVALYEPDAVLAGQVMIGNEAIHKFYARLLADRPTFVAGEQRPALPRQPRADLVAAREWHRHSRGCAATNRRHVAVGHRSACLF